ncbi:hypothetical protein HanIR_Chr04g0165541 [Helianthus annuus]|nr:hypothetical protein HanIR_Chr04g0165541 [Helianthus annuus]
MAGVLDYLFIYNIMFSYNCSLVCSHANLWEISPLLMLGPITKLWVLVFFFFFFFLFSLYL